MNSTNEGLKTVTDMRYVRFFENIGKAIHDQRKYAKRVTQDALCERLKIKKNTLSDIENGKRNFSMATFFDIAQGLDIHPVDLFKRGFPRYKSTGRQSEIKESINRYINRLSSEQIACILDLCSVFDALNRVIGMLGDISGEDPVKIMKEIKKNERKR